MQASRARVQPDPEPQRAKHTSVASCLSEARVAGREKATVVSPVALPVCASRGSADQIAPDSEAPLLVCTPSAIFSLSIDVYGSALAGPGY